MRCWRRWWGVARTATLPSLQPIGTRPLSTDTGPGRGQPLDSCCIHACIACWHGPSFTHTACWTRLLDMHSACWTRTQPAGDACKAHSLPAAGHARSLLDMHSACWTQACASPRTALVNRQQAECMSRAHTNRQCTCKCSSEEDSCVCVCVRERVCARTHMCYSVAFTLCSVSPIPSHWQTSLRGTLAHKVVIWKECMHTRPCKALTAPGPAPASA